MGAILDVIPVKKGRGGRPNRMKAIQSALFDALFYGGIVEPEHFQEQHNISERTFRIVLSKLRGEDDKFSRIFGPAEKTLRIEFRRPGNLSFYFCPDRVSEELVNLMVEERAARFKRLQEAKKASQQYRKNLIVVNEGSEDGFDWGYDSNEDSAREVWNISEEGLLRYARILKAKGLPTDELEVNEYGQPVKDGSAFVCKLAPATTAGLTKTLVEFCRTHPAGPPFPENYLRNVASHVVDKTPFLSESHFVTPPTPVDPEAAATAAAEARVKKWREERPDCTGEDFIAWLKAEGFAEYLSIEKINSICQEPHEPVPSNVTSSAVEKPF